MEFKNPRINDYNGDLTRRWYIQFACKDTDTNKFIEFREWVSSSHKTRTARYVAAKKLRDGIQKKLNEGYNPFDKKADRLSVREAIKIIIEIKEKTTRKRTYTSYKSAGKLFCDWLECEDLQHLEPKQITFNIVRKYFDQVLLLEKVCARTYNNRLRDLRTLFYAIKKRQLVEYNIFTNIEFLEVAESALRAYGPEEKKDISHAIKIKFPELWLHALFVYYCLIRPQELCRLHISHINFEHRTLFIPGEHSKNKKTRTIIIPQPLIDQLILMGYDKLDTELFIFSNGRKLTPGKKEISPNRVYEAWRLNIKEVLNTDKGIYLFKHTGAGELFESGADPRNIQLQLRHKSLEETLVYLEKYSNRPNESLRKHFVAI